MGKSDQEVMRIRAGAISGVQAETKSLDDSLLVVEFLLGTEKYAIDSSFVKEVLSFRNLTRVPGTPNFVAGLINLRGKIISVINLMSFLYQKETVISAQNKIIVIGHQHMEFGFVADEILGTKLLDIRSLCIPPVTDHRSGDDYIYGLAPEGITLLNADSILSDEKIIINQK
jgi:purine-binding chemotaxis protein CheW